MFRYILRGTVAITSSDCRKQSPHATVISYSLKGPKAKTERKKYFHVMDLLVTLSTDVCITFTDAEAGRGMSSIISITLNHFLDMSFQL